ncbi:unnamed protein product [Caenorhabditis angaria]|uniref:Innexin n=1 Tax=Caenorhabditis angaria TaxID=860376 RepID=A0A9P1I463_9PELO|nr:unnamed protein product [Caenorhabditis angaria]
MMFGAMIVCRSPKEAPDTWVNYFDNFCYYQDKFKLDAVQAATRTTTRGSLSEVLFKENDVITYYQWIPYSMIVQIVLCLLPAMVWRNFGLRFFHGADFDAVLRGFIEKMPGEAKGVTIKWIKEDDWKRMARTVQRLLKLKKTDRFGLRSTMFIYVAQKWIGFWSFVFQFYLLAKMFANGGIMWGVHLTYNLLHSELVDLKGGLFPRMVHCSVDKADLASTHSYSLNCLLAQNFINEKVFLFLYWWFIFAIIVSFCSAIRFSALLFSPRYQRYTTKSLLPCQEYFMDTTTGGDFAQPENNDLLEYFVDYLGCDGYLLLQLVGDMMHLMSVRMLSKELWRRIIVQQRHEDEEDVVAVKSEEEKKKEEENQGCGDSTQPTAPPMDARYYAGKDGKKEKKKQRENSEEKQPLIEDRPSSSSSTKSSTTVSPPPPTRYQNQKPDIFRTANEDSDNSPVFRN